jgi:hypothetical protein
VNRRAQLICVWTGPVLTVLFIVGAVLLGRFIPPWAHPSNDPGEVAAIFTEHAERIRLGALITIISMSLIAPWGVAIAAQTRRTEGDFPVLTYLQLMCVAVGTAIVVLMSMFWAVATFRPYDPEIVQLCNDIAYFLFLFTWPPFSVWVISIALSIFLDPSEQRVYPRWAAYLNLWVGLLFVPAGLMAFFKHGAFSWSGMMALYVPVIAFFIWLVTMTVLTIRNIRQGAVYEPAWSSNGAGAVRGLAPGPSPSARPAGRTSR